MNALPPSFVEEMRGLLGTEADDLFDALQRPPVRGVRRNALKVSADDFAALFGPFPRIPYADDGYYADGDAFHGYTPAHHAGLFYIQEPGAQFPVRLLGGRRFRRALDLCAAPGGKSGQLACFCDELYANEPVYKRAHILCGNLERLGVRNAVVTCNRPDEYAAVAAGSFDLVVVDAPCSGEGMFRKEPAAVEAYSAAHVAACAVRSSAILHSAAACVGEGGYLLYSTCTFNRSENEGVLRAFLQAHPDFSALPVPPELRPHVYSTDFEGGARLLPHRIDCEGQFACLLQRADGERPTLKTTALPAARGKEWKAVFSQVSADPPWMSASEMRGKIVLSPRIPVGLNVLAAGVAVATVDKLPRPCHALAAALLKGHTVHAVDFTLDAPELYAYLKGEQLSADFTGWGVVTAAGFPLGLVKASGGTAKNHYPKGLYNRIDPARR